MKKVSIILCVSFVVSSSLAAEPFAGEVCGPRASFLTRLVTDAEKIRIQCINDYFEAEKAKADALAIEISKEIKKQKEVMNKAAYRSNDSLNRVNCDFPSAISDAAAKEKQCRKEVALYNALIAQLNEVMGWNVVFKKPVSSSDSPDKVMADLQAPCPDKETLDKIRPVRLFKRGLYEVYERCEVLRN